MYVIHYAHFAPDPDGGILVTFPDLPEAITHGATLAEARANAADALETVLLHAADLGETRPLSPAPKTAARAVADGLVAIPVPAQVAIKLATVAAFETWNRPKVELSEAIGRPANEAWRVLDPRHNTKVKVLEQALFAMGKEVVIEVRDLAR